MSQAGKLVGYTLSHPLEDRSVIHIDHLAVSPAEHGKGFGKVLLQKTAEQNPESTAIVLTTRILNKNAQAFYEKQGFYSLDKHMSGVACDKTYSVMLKKDLR